MLNVGGVTWLTAISRRGTARAERQTEASLRPRRLRSARCLNLTMLRRFVLVSNASSASPWCTLLKSNRRGAERAERQAEASLRPRRLRGARCLNLTAEALRAQRDKLKPLCALGVSAVHAADSTFKRRIPRCWGVLR